MSKPFKLRDSLTVQDLKRRATVNRREASERIPLRKCVSCSTPATVAQRIGRLSGIGLKIGHASSATLHHKHAMYFALNRPTSLPSLHITTAPQMQCVRAYSKCPPCPSCCGSLPPPCNQPPRCIQCMTGYYYYPYGYWFCGPYHVTGQCCPIGPCGPCGGPKRCPAPACVCPAATYVMTPTGHSAQGTMPEKTYESPLFRHRTQSAQPNVREYEVTQKSSFSKLFPFTTTVCDDGNTKPESTPKKEEPTLHSSFFCLPYAFKTPIDNFRNTAKVAKDQRKSNTISHSRMNSTKCFSRIDPKVGATRSKRCKYTGYIRPLTLPRKYKEDPYKF
ncbi:unnamed protein product, partial [Iphiclides podalirius]